MDKESANKEFDSIAQTCDNIWFFIEHLYKHGHVICSPEDMKKINSMTILAETHGMNPFNPGHEQVLLKRKRDMD